MSATWLHIIGIGDDGLDGLSAASLSALENASIIIGGDRHHALTQALGERQGHSITRIKWPSPFDALLSEISSYRGQQLAILVSGDPLWYSAGVKIAAHFQASELCIHPHPSAFQLAASRLSWPMAQIQTLSTHGRSSAHIIPFLQPHARLLVLTSGADCPKTIAQLLTERGYGNSVLWAFAHMGGQNETHYTANAKEWSHNVPPFHTLAIECIPSPDTKIYASTPGLADELFCSDGTMTKRDIRAVTLAKLMPMTGALLWDIGCGSGSVSIEWMRAAQGARAIGIEPRDDRRALAASNAHALGTPNLSLIAGSAPASLTELPEPDAVFMGGGLSEESFQIAWHKLRPFGRLVANAVTLESESLLMQLFQRYGGELTKHALCHAETIGARTAWRPMMPVTQWSLIKP